MNVGDQFGLEEWLDGRGSEFETSFGLEEWLDGVGEEGRLNVGDQFGISSFVVGVLAFHSLQFDRKSGVECQMPVLKALLCSQ